MKKVIVFLVFCLFTTVFTFAQKDINFQVSYSQDAHYPGSDTALLMYFMENLRYSDEAINSNVTGTAMLSFTVMPDSSITDVVPLSNIGYGLEAQVAELVKKLRYAPAVANGSPYKSNVIINVRINAADSRYFHD
ncbi:MAG TPA: energy transducer TonB [Bacteroidales bacterium]|nr:energy transducer TonB [Bacteroidales bacterium]